MNHSFSLSKVSELDISSESMAAISKQLEELLLLLRSRHGKEENLKIDSIPTSPQLPESRDVNRPEPKPSYVINATPDVTKASSPLSNRTIKRHQRISFEEMDKRRFNGLCLFCEESETPHHYLLHKNSGILMIDCDEDQSCDDEELVEMEVVTESNGIEVNKQRQFQVPISDSEILRNIELREENSELENQEHVVLNDNLEQEWVQKNISKRSEVGGDVEGGQKVPNMKKICSAHQVFGKMSQHETLGLKKKTKGFKSWRFKFKLRKQQRGKLRSAHQLNHRRNVMYKYICSSAKVVLMKKNKSFKTWPTLKDDCFREDDQVYLEELPLWLIVRFKFWKFKFMNKNLQKMMREHGYSSFLKLKSDVGDDEGMFSGAKAVSMRFLLGIMLGITETDHASEGQQAVFEQILMVNEWLQISFVIQQVMRNKKIRLSKRWWFKYRFGEEDQGSLQSRTEYSLSRRKTFLKTWMFKYKYVEECIKRLHSQLRLQSKKKQRKGHKSWMFKYKFDEEDQGLLQSRTGWTQEEAAVIRFLLRRHSYLNLDCEAPELAGRKRNHCCDWFEVQKNLVQQMLLVEDIKENDQKQQGDWGHYFLLFAAANWSSQMHLWSTSYRVWHRWKARDLLSGPMKLLRKQLGNFSLTYRSDFQHLNLEDKVLRRREI